MLPMHTNSRRIDCSEAKPDSRALSTGAGRQLAESSNRIWPLAITVLHRFSRRQQSRWTVTMCCSLWPSLPKM